MWASISGILELRRLFLRQQESWKDSGSRKAAEKHEIEKIKYGYSRKARTVSRLAACGCRTLRYMPPDVLGNVGLQSEKQ